MKTSSLVGLVPETSYTADIVIDRIEKEGEILTKRPIMFLCRFEKTGISFKITSWFYSELDDYREAMENHTVCTVSFMAKMYKNALSFNLESFEDTGKPSSLEVKVFPASVYEEEINNLIETVKNENYKKILKKLIIPTFYTWPAAYSMHHAFPGGLALHSYSVANIALKIAENYNFSNINYDVLVTGALLHDIGKMREYNSNGTFSLTGNLLPHIILGIEMIDSACYSLGINYDSDEILFLKHIISSHHGKLEFGSPIVPKTIEAYIIAQADNADSHVEAIQEAFDSNQNSFNDYDDGFTLPIKAVENGKFMKPDMYNKKNNSKIK